MYLRLVECEWNIKSKSKNCDKIIEGKEEISTVISKRTRFYGTDTDALLNPVMYVIYSIVLKWMN